MELRDWLPRRVERPLSSSSRLAHPIDPGPNHLGLLLLGLNPSTTTTILTRRPCGGGRSGVRPGQGRSPWWASLPSSCPMSKPVRESSRTRQLEPRSLPKRPLTRCLTVVMCTVTFAGTMLDFAGKDPWTKRWRYSLTWAMLMSPQRVTGKHSRRLRRKCSEPWDCDCDVLMMTMWFHSVLLVRRFLIRERKDLLPETGH